MNHQPSKKRFISATLFTMMVITLLLLTARANAQAVGSLSDTNSAANEVTENSSTGTAVGITAQAANATTYTLTDSVDGLFAIDPKSGVVTVAMDLLDYEAFSSHSITVQARNAISNQTMPMPFTIRVTDVNEPVGHITDLNFNPNRIAFGSTSGDTVGITARAVDPDQGSTVSYSLTENPDSLFTIGEQDGVITLASGDYNPEQNYLIEVTAESDDDTSSTAQFTVRADESIRIALTPATPAIAEGESKDLVFSIESDLELKGISAGDYHSCGITVDNRAVCWGDNANKRSSPPPGSQSGRFIAVSSGFFHNCALTLDNNAVCWGLDSFGSTMPSTSQSFVAISAGGRHSCGLTPDSAAVCWGDNSSQQTMPIPDNSFIAISAGFNHNCAVTADNEAVCWGSNSDGQSAPPRGRKFAAISAGSAHSCGITLSNAAVCWGDNSNNQVMPIPDNSFIAISAGSAHSCAITTDNAAVCWGDNSNNQVMPIPDNSFIAISAGDNHSCGITADNKAVCWGSDSNNQRTLPQTTPILADSIIITLTVADADKGQITINKNGRAVIPVGETQSTLTVTVSDDGVNKSVTNHTITLAIEGHAVFNANHITITVIDSGVIASLRDADGEAGGIVAENSPIGSEVGITARAVNATTYTLTDSADGLFAVNPQSGVVSVADRVNYEAFSSHRITVQASNAISSEIISFFIQVTDVPEPLRRIADVDLSPNEIAFGSMRGDAVGITARAVDPDLGSVVNYRLSENPGGLFTIGQRDGIVTLASGGYNPGQDYRIEATAVSSDGTSRAAQFAIRPDEPIRIAPSPTAFALREGESQSITFSLAETELEFKDIGAGELHTCAITPDNDVVCWGRTDEGQSTPPPNRKFIAIAAGDFHTCGITLDNDAVCWGNDGGGRSSPPSGEKFIAIAAGHSHSCAVTADNEAVCWGFNANGQVSPIPEGKYIAITAGDSHSCAITPDNDAVCWGVNTFGEGSPPTNQKFIAIAAGRFHSCGITLDNDAVCWGSNFHNRANPASSPQVNANTGFLSVSVDNTHSCGITTDNNAVCWGSNADGQSAPPANQKLIAISAGNFHSCGITTDNKAVCWGSNKTSRGILVGQSMPPQIIPAAADDPITIAAMISDADRGQINLSDNGQIIIPAGETQATLTVTAGNDNIIEPETDYTISLSATGHTALERDALIITVPVDDRDIVKDIDDRDNKVAENAPMGAEVGITAQAADATNYRLSDDNGGLFAINPQSGTVTVAMDALDYEAFSFHTIVIEITTHGGGKSTASLDIQITDVPEPVSHITDIDLSPNKISRSAMSGDAVGITARAVDPDQNSAVSYSLTENPDSLFAIGRQDGVVTLASSDYNPRQNYPIEVTAMSDDGTSSAAQFTVRADEPIRIALSHTASILKEGASQPVTFSFAKTELEFKDISAGRSHSCGITPNDRAVCWGNPANNRSAPPPDRLIAISAGRRHSCGITPDNDAVCWGSDDGKQSAPPPVRKFIAVSAGAFHTCGLATDSKAVCWGSNSEGQSKPSLTRRFIAVSAGEEHSCAITPDNEAVCWGSNSAGQSAPPAGRKLTALSAGKFHSCAITLDSDAVCWGSSSAGKRTPPPGRKFIAVSAGEEHSCAITPDNDAVCWGSNSAGQSAPPSGRKFIAISAGRRHSCGITADNRAVCWGSNDEGQRTLSQMPPIANDPITITAVLSDAARRQISLSDNGQAVISARETQTTLIITADDDDAKEPEARYTVKLSVAGSAELERDEIIITVPVDDRDIVEDADAADNKVAENSPAGSTVGITVKAPGATAYTLSDDADGLFAINPQSGIVTVAADRLDYEAFSSHTISAQATVATRTLTIHLSIQVTDVAEPIGHIADIDFSPDRINYGSTQGDTVGITARATDPDQGSTVAYTLSEDSTGLFTIGSQDGVVALASNNYEPDQDYLIEVTAESDDKTSSTAQFTIQPDEPTRIASSPTTSTVREGESQVITFSFTEIKFEIKAIGAGHSHTCAITPDSDAVCWGSNSAGQSAPPSGRKFIAISAGNNHSCGITTDNDAVCWGSSSAGKRTPPPGRKFIAVSAAASHTCGITTGNDALCWGSNANDLSSPPLGKKFIAVSAGNSHSCAITTDNDAVCWGRNHEKQSAPPATRKFITVSVGRVHSCAITTDNDAFCWGLGAGANIPPLDSKLTAISAGSDHTCAITSGNDALCWGFDVSGSTMPPSGRKFVAISAGFNHTCAITPDSDAVCWGSSGDGKSSPSQTIIPIAADPITIIAMISGADRGQISLSDNGQVIIPAGETQATLTVTAGDDKVREPETDYTIPLSATGFTALEEDALSVTVPVDSRDTQVIGDLDATAGAVAAGAATAGIVAENSPVDAEVGIIVHAANTTNYSLIDRAGGRFAINNNGLVTVADGSLLNFEDATTHSIIAQAGNADRSTIQLTIQVANLNEITLEDTDDANNTVRASSTGIIVVGLALAATHADNAAIMSWEITTQTSASININLLEFSEPAESSNTRTLRIKADANLASIATPITVRLSVRVQTAADATSEDFDVRVFPATSAEGIRLRIRVYLEGALD